jgi:hypothetical protein
LKKAEVADQQADLQLVAAIGNTVNEDSHADTLEP